MNLTANQNGWAKALVGTPVELTGRAALEALHRYQDTYKTIENVEVDGDYVVVTVTGGIRVILIGSDKTRLAFQGETSKRNSAMLASCVARLAKPYDCQAAYRKRMEKK